MYEIFEHTADVGLRIRAPNVTQLFVEAGEALFSLMVENLDVVRPRQEVFIDIEADRWDELFHDWLSELLYIFHADHLVLVEFNVGVQSDGLTGTVRGEPIDPQRHKFGPEVKAITYHGLKVEQQQPNQWLAEVIVDV